MSQNLTVDGFELVENTSQFSKDFIETKINIVMKEIFLKLMFRILKTYMDFIMINWLTLFVWKNENWKACGQLWQ